MTRTATGRLPGNSRSDYGLSDIDRQRPGTDRSAGHADTEDPVSDGSGTLDMTRREVLGTVGKAAVATVVLPPFVGGREPGAIGSRAARALPADASGAARRTPHAAAAGPDRVTVLPWLDLHQRLGGAWRATRAAAPALGRSRTAVSRAGARGDRELVEESGPGDVTFADPSAVVTSASFSAPGAYVLRLTAKDGEEEVTSSFRVTVEAPPSRLPLEAVHTKRYRITDRLWGRRARALMVNWIPWCIDQINRSDLELGPGGIDNFIEAARALAASRTVSTRATCSPTPGCIRPSRPCASRSWSIPGTIPRSSPLTRRCARRWRTGSRRSWRRGSPTATCTPRSPCATATGGPSAGHPKAGGITKVTWPDTSSSRPSTTTS